MLLKKTSTSLIFTKLIVFRALFASEILRVDSPVSNIIYVPQVRPPRLPWCKCPDIFVGQHMTRHNKKEATVRPLPNSPLWSTRHGMLNLLHIYGIMHCAQTTYTEGTGTGGSLV